MLNRNRAFGNIDTTNSELFGFKGNNVFFRVAFLYGQEGVFWLARPR